MLGLLRNIKFKEARADVRGIYKVPRILVKWELEPTSQKLNNLFFFIDRSESDAECDLKQISTDPIPANEKNEFMDFDVRLKDINKVYYYRVRAVEMLNGQAVQTFKSETFEQREDPPDLVALYIIEEHLFAHRWVYGVPAVIYTKKAEGFRCEECWDNVLKRQTNSHCERCYGTGFIGGYYQPIPAWIDFSPSPEIVQIADFGEKQLHETDIQFTDYPSLQVGDLILQGKPLVFWRVENVRSTLKNQTTILQIARLNMVNRSDIEWALPIPHDILDKMAKELAERSRESEFL